MTASAAIQPFATVADLSRAIAGGLSPVAVMDHYLDRIRRLDGKLHAYVRVYEAEARMAAEGAERAIRSGHALGPLHGIPIALKDLVDMQGRITTGGSMVWRERVSPVTATLAATLIRAGMIVIGKTHTVEFAMGAWGTNEHMGTPWNPWDLAVPRTPGGSSAGSGVAVASGMAPAAIGTDTGGSVRVPAAWCGIVGLKTTIGRISTYGVLPLSHSLDTPGPITGTVEDAALLFDVLHGPDPRDPQTLPHPRTDVLSGMRRGVGGLRLARLPAAEREGIDAAVLAAYDESLETLAGLGAEIVDIRLPAPLSAGAEATGRLIGAEGYRHVGHLTDDMSLPVDPAVRPRIGIGRDISAREYMQILTRMQADAEAFDAALANIDALLAPTTLTPPLPLDRVDQSKTAAVLTRPFNYLKRCALSLPNGFTGDGLPLSLQIVCRPYDEATALRIGWAYEQATPWHQRHPAGL